MSYTLVVPVDDIDSFEVNVKRHVGAPLAAPALGKVSVAPIVDVEDRM
jgi:hypothetical protein